MVRRVSSPSIVGRAAERAALREGLAAAAAGASRVVLVAGESGVGKSRLLVDLAAAASESGALVLEGDCIELGDGELPYAPIVGALRDITRAIEPGTLAAVPEAGRRELSRLVPALGSGAAVGSAASQPVLFEAVLGLLTRLAKERPVVLLIEDLHWADRSTRDLFAFLARSFRRDRLLIIATYRSDELHRRHPLRGLLAELARLPAIDRIDLVRLSRDELAEQLAGILASAPDGDLVRRIYERSEGNPFFAEELLAAGAEGALPDTLRDALLVRLEALPEASRQLLRILAAAGRPVLGELLAAAAETTEEAVSAAMREAVEQHVVSVTEDRHFRFRHALFGEATYDDLLPGERVRVHRALAQALAEAPALAPASESIAAAELAHHWQAAQAIPEALGASTAAGIAARAAAAYAEAVRHLRTALELWDRVPDAQRRAGVSHSAILGHVGQSAHLAGDYEEGIAYLTKAARAFEDEDNPTDAALMQIRLGRCFWAAGRSSDAIAAHARAVELSPPDPTPERAQVLALMARVLMISDRVAESLPIAEEALAIARAVGAREAEGHALNTIGIDVAQLEDRERGIAILRVALAIAEEFGFADELGSSYVNISDQIDQAGRIEEAAELAIKGMHASERAGAVRLHGAFLAAEAAARLTRLGRYDEAEQLVADALQRNAGGRTEAALHQRRAQILIERGLPAAAEHALDVARRTIDFTISQWIGPQAASEVEAALWLGEPERAASIAEHFLARLGDSFFANLVAALHAHRLRAEADTRLLRRARGELAGDLGPARSLQQGPARLLGPGAGPEVHAWVTLAHAEARRAEGIACASAFADAADRFSRLAMPFRTAYARLREVEARLDEGAGRGEVADRLQEALRLAQGIGAPLLVGEIERLARRGRVTLNVADPELPAADTPPAPFGLTARELEVLVLVAEGRTNKEIGSRLYMSSKTASAHVSHILAKLAARNRGEAAAIAARLGLDGASPEPAS